MANTVRIRAVNVDVNDEPAGTWTVRLYRDERIINVVQGDNGKLTVYIEQDDREVHCAART